MPTETEVAIAAIWRRQIPQTRDRLQLLARVAEELSTTRAIDPKLRAEAVAIAHKLAGSLGMFGYDAGTDHARLVQHELEHGGLPQPERLQQHVDDLRASLTDALAEA